MEEITQEILLVDDGTQDDHVVAHAREREPVDPLEVEGRQLRRCRVQRCRGHGQRRAGFVRGAAGAGEAEDAAVVEEGAVNGQGWLREGVCVAADGGRGG